MSSRVTTQARVPADGQPALPSAESAPRQDRRRAIGNRGTVRRLAPLFAGEEALGEEDLRAGQSHGAVHGDVIAVAAARRYTEQDVGQGDQWR